MKRIWQIIYYFFVYPGIVLAAHVLAIFVKKVRRALFPKYSTSKKLAEWIKENPPVGRVVLFHTASLGEFEHIRPILQTLKKKFYTTNIVTFFSPSGYENVGEIEGLDYHLYIPFDWPVNWHKLYDIISPVMVVVAKHDVWPGQIWTAQKRNIPAFLINASLNVKSSRTGFGVKTFLKHVYRDFQCICSISEEDAQKFARHYPRSHVQITGDTKYDQVVLRKERARAQSLLPESWLARKWVFVAGSIWPEDEAQLFPAIKKLLAENETMCFILVPHQPEEKTVARISGHFKDWGVAFFSRLKNLSNERILIIDSVGHLAGLYHHAQAAYVGGGFQQGIHSTMEPAIFGIPVIYGPVYENSYEAIQFSKNNGGIVVNNSNEIYKWVNLFYTDEIRRKELGTKAEKFATRNTGATEILINNWQKHALNTDSFQ